MSNSAEFELAKDLALRAKKAGFLVSTDQIARWSRDGLLPKPHQHGFGSGIGGSETHYPIGTGVQLIALCQFHFTERFRKLEAVGWYLWLSGFTVSDKYWRRPLEVAASTFTDRQQLIKKRLLDTASGVVSLRPTGLRVFAGLSTARTENRHFLRVRRRVGTAQIGDLCRLLTTIAVGAYQADSEHNDADREEERSRFERGLGLARAYIDRLDNGVTLLSEPFEPDLERFSDQIKKISKPSLLRLITTERMKQARNDLRLLLWGLRGTYLNLEKEYGKHAFGLGVIADFGTITDIKLQALVILLFDATIRSDPDNQLRKILAEIEAKRVSNGRQPDDTEPAR
jgi:hypothetical protein